MGTRLALHHCYRLWHYITAGRVVSLFPSHYAIDTVGIYYYVHIVVQQTTSVVRFHGSMCE